MKSKDWQAVVAIAVVSIVISFAVSGFIINSSKSKSLLVEKINPISSDFPLPKEDYFNDNSLNPTQDIKIDEQSNSSPFKKN